MKDSLLGDSNRRGALGWMAVFSLAPLLSTGWASRILAADTGFTAPDTAMRLTRTIVRDLADGAQIIVKRVWQIRFAPSSGGYSVNGTQISVEVEAPPALEFLAALERKKVETGMFPIRLDQNGAIVLAQPQSDESLLDRAISLSLQKIGAGSLDADEASEARRFLATIQQSAAQLVSALPQDLFCPQRTAWQDSRMISLPGGAHGQLSITFTAQMAASGGVMQRVERRIVTTVGTSSRTSREIWEMAPL